MIKDKRFPMIKDCQNSHQLYTAKLNEEKHQKRLQDENAQKEGTKGKRIGKN